MTDVQARCRRIIADIGRHAFLGEQVVEPRFIGHLMNEAALGEDAEEIGLELRHDGLAFASFLAVSIWEIRARFSIVF